VHAHACFHGPTISNCEPARLQRSAAACCRIAESLAHDEAVQAHRPLNIIFNKLFLPDLDALPLLLDNNAGHGHTVVKYYAFNDSALAVCFKSSIHLKLQFRCSFRIIT
jgi:hypothetical protein